jgi:hypothetical protein
MLRLGEPPFKIRNAAFRHIVLAGDSSMPLASASHDIEDFNGWRPGVWNVPTTGRSSVLPIGFFKWVRNGRPGPGSNDHPMSSWIILVVGIAGTLALPLYLMYVFGCIMGRVLGPSSDMDGECEKWSGMVLTPLTVLSLLLGGSVTCFLLYGEWWFLAAALLMAALIAALFFVTARKARKARPKNIFLQVAEQLHRAGKLDASHVEKFRQAAQMLEPESTTTLPAETTEPGSPSTDEASSTEEQARAFVAAIPAHAEQHRKSAKEIFGLDLNYDTDSIAQLDRMIREGWPKEPPALLEQVVTGFGSYLGETIRHLHGGDWCYKEEEGLHLDVGNRGIRIFPFTKVERRFLNGEMDSLEAFYSAVLSKLAEGQNAK